ncbi:hypothetical protein [Streptomyces anulatus]|uniref:hypothetical protein n=1 Tax=Streptomyces anulatus TaxID=1892 RepID=UPI001D188812|nr:hypothetical protein [Streptomyces anulatus]
MARVRITSATSVADGAGGRYQHGQVVDIDDGLAKAWIAAGHAESSKDEPATGRPEGRREATRRAPRTTAKKAAGATNSDAAAAESDGGN